MTATETKAALDAQAPTKPLLRTLAEILADLKKPPAQKHIRTKRKGGTDLEFIPWYFVIQYLDLYAPGWCYEIRSVTEIKGQVILTVRITIHTSDFGPVWREASGIEEEETNSYGDPSSNAESMALRRAAAKLGFGLYLYDKK
jgi:hypothetical protein